MDIADVVSSKGLSNELLILTTVIIRFFLDLNSSVLEEREASSGDDAAVKCGGRQEGEHYGVGTV